MIALTFDDGPGPTTNKILDILKKYKILATFFITGDNLINCPWSQFPNLGWTIGKRIITDGHIIGNHTFNHYSKFQEENEFLKEITDVDLLIKKLYEDVGIMYKTPPIRLPFGIKINPYRLNYLGSLGRPHIHWSSDFNDWHEGPIDALSSSIIKYIETREANGLNSVLDLHDGGIGNENGFRRDATANAIEVLLKEAIKRRWLFFQCPLRY